MHAVELCMQHTNRICLCKISYYACRVLLQMFVTSDAGGGLDHSFRVVGQGAEDDD